MVARRIPQKHSFYWKQGSAVWPAQLQPQQQVFLLAIIGAEVDWRKRENHMAVRRLFFYWFFIGRTAWFSFSFPRELPVCKENPLVKILQAAHDNASDSQFLILFSLSFSWGNLRLYAALSFLRLIGRQNKEKEKKTAAESRKEWAIAALCCPKNGLSLLALILYTFLGQQGGAGKASFLPVIYWDHRNNKK